MGINQVPSDDLSKSTIDAKGDLIVGSADDTVSRLAVGTNGQLLSADSTTTTGLKWIANSAAVGGGAFILSSGSLAGPYTYNVNVPVGAAVLDLKNTQFNGLVGINATFGTSTYKTYTWGTTQASAFTINSLNVYASSALTSVTIDTVPSGLWDSNLVTGFGVSNLTQSIAFGNGVFALTTTVYAAATSNSPSVIHSSTNGITWTSRYTFGATSQAAFLNYGNIFVATTAAGILGAERYATSTDGITWTGRAWPSTNWRAITRPEYVEGLATPWFLWVNSNSTQFWAGSTDGITWTTRPAPANGPASTIAGHSNFTTARVIALDTNTGGLPANYYYSSTDGVTWTSRPFGTTINTNYAGSLATDGSKYVLMEQKNVYNSTDGITWTVASVHENTFGISTNPGGLSYNSAPTAKWVASGSLATGAPGAGMVLSSSDGVTFYPHVGTNGSFEFPPNKYAFAYGNGTWAMKPLLNSSGAANGTTYVSVNGNGKIRGEIQGFITTYTPSTTLA